MRVRSVRDKLLKHLEKLSAEQQERLLAFARSLSGTTDAPKGRSGKDLVSFAGAIEKHEMEAIANAIQEDCERTDASAW